MNFGTALRDGFTAGKRLCVGIDPHAYLLESAHFPDSALGAERFALHLVEAAAGHALAVKPQVAFFERFGAAGYAALETVLESAREANLLIIADAKRGDVGSSFDAYADAWLSPGSPLEADALTVSPFQGFGVLTGALAHATQNGKGLFVLVATSNPEAAVIQQAQVRSGLSVSAHLMSEVDEFNRSQPQSQSIANVGAVLGATLKLSDFGINATDDGEPASGPIMPILAPGFGHQGGNMEHVRESFGQLARGMIVTESRSLVADGVEQVSVKIAERSEELSRENWGTLGGA